MGLGQDSSRVFYTWSFMSGHPSELIYCLRVAWIATSQTSDDLLIETMARFPALAATFVVHGRGHRGRPRHGRQVLRYKGAVWRAAFKLKSKHKARLIDEYDLLLSIHAMT